MFDNFANVFSQILILCLLMAAGFICGKAKIISTAGESCIAGLNLYISMPCVVIASFQRSFEPELWRGFVLTLLVTVATYALSIVFAHATLRGKNRGTVNTLRFASVFSNCGFMSLPMAQSLYGEEGVFYCAAIIAIFNLLIWTYGYIIMGESKRLPLKKILLNPGLLALLAGLLLFFSSTRLPITLGSAITHMGNLNTPLGMMIIGSRLSRTDIRGIFGHRQSWLCAAERLVLIPLALIAALWALDIRGVAAMVCLLVACAPAASATTMFAVLFKHDEELAANAVSSQTIFSAATMPLIIGLAQTLLM